MTNLKCHIGWYNHRDIAEAGAKELKNKGKKYRIVKQNVGWILYELIKVQEK